MATVIAVPENLLSLILFLLNTLSGLYHDVMQVVKDDASYGDNNSRKYVNSFLYGSIDNEQSFLNMFKARNKKIDIHEIKRFANWRSLFETL